VFGKVTLCRHRDTCELVAIKSIHKNSMIQSGRVHAILSERAVLARLRHPFLTELRFAFQSPTKFHLGLEYVPGGDLLGLIRRTGRVPLSDAKIYIAELGLALDALHRAGIVYRDVKPDNVLIGADGHLKLADFCLAKEIGQNSTSSFCGTIDYIAPEIIRGRQYAHAIDWWALGVLSYLLIFGESPFFDANREKMLTKILNSRPNFPQNADGAIVDFVEKLLIKDPDHRFGFDGLKAHRFFDRMCVGDVLEKRVAPSFVPQAQGIASLHSIDAEFTIERTIDSLGSFADHDDPFQGFDFMNDEKQEWR
jgi:serine/threonine protein kinase